MDIIPLINKAKAHLLNIIIIVIAVIIAFNNSKTKAHDRKLLKDRINTELSKNEVLRDISNLEGRFTSLKKRINNKAISLVISLLGNMAKESDVRIILIKPQKENYLGVYTKYPFELVVSAKSYHKIGKFISIIENSPDIYIVENMVITSNPNEKEEDKVIIKLVLNTILIN